MSVSTLSRKRSTARKPHQCVWCGCSVLTGSRYERQHIIIDGEFQSNAWHEACLTGFDGFWKETREEEFIPGEQEMPFFALYQMEATTPSPQPKRGAVADD